MSDENENLSGEHSTKKLHEDFPASVTLRFRSEFEKRWFMGQLSDGFGEGQVDLVWPWRAGVQFDECPSFGVRPLGEDFDD